MRLSEDILKILGQSLSTRNANFLTDTLIFLDERWHFERQKPAGFQNFFLKLSHLKQQPKCLQFI